MYGCKWMDGHLRVFTDCQCYQGLSFNLGSGKKVLVPGTSG